MWPFIFQDLSPGSSFATSTELMARFDESLNYSAQLPRQASHVQPHPLFLFSQPGMALNNPPAETLLIILEAQFKCQFLPNVFPEPSEVRVARLSKVNIRYSVKLELQTQNVGFLMQAYSIS